MKQVLSYRPRTSRYISAAAAVLLAISPMQPLGALSIDEQIQQKQTEASQLNEKVEDLNVYGNTLAEAVANLNSRIANLQSKIKKNQAKKAQLQAEIEQAQKDIDERNEALAGNLRMMYLEGEVSSLEKVASSKSISEYVDKQEARNRIQNRVKTAMDEIKALKEKLEGSKAAVEAIIKEDLAMQKQISKQKNAKAKLLKQTRGKEAAYRQQVSKRKAEIASLYAQQAAAIAAATGGGTRNFGVIGSFEFRNVQRGGQCGGGYGNPRAAGYDDYCLVEHDGMVDEFQLYNRECVAYAAWAAKYRFNGNVSGFMGMGNAYQWPSTATAYMGASLGGPAAGAVAIVPAQAGFPLGHAMVVEGFTGDGWIRVSQYNWDVNGMYSTMEIKNSGVLFLHF